MTGDTSGRAKSKGQRLTRLRRIRDERVITQAELAERADVDRGQLSRIERGLQGVHPATARRLAEALGVEVQDLVEPPVLGDLRRALEAAEERGGRQEQVAELQRYLERDPERLRRWIYEESLAELEVRGSLAEREYTEAMRGAGRATGKAMELYPLLLALGLERLLEMVSGRREPGASEESAPVEAPETAPAPVSRPPRAAESRTEAAEEED